MILTILTLLAANPSTQGIPTISDDTRAIVRTSDKMTSDEIIASLQKLSDAGDESAEMLMAESLFGAALDVKRDVKKACDIFERLHLKYGEAAHNFATCFYRNDGGRQQDFARARVEYLNAIAMGWPDSPCALGNMLIAGQGGAKEVERGLALCLQAAESGIAHAQADYGTYYLIGKIVPKDTQIAFKWLQKASDQRHANASSLLAQMHQKGDGVKLDKAKAAELFAVAYKGGRFDAAYNIAMVNASLLINNVDGKVKLDKSYLVETKRWLEIAVKEEPNPDRKKNASELLEELSQFDSH